jgi:DNA-directed RNA polymerase subunit M
MEFCPACGMRLLVLKKRGRKSLLRCPKCGCEKWATDLPMERTRKESIIVIGRGEQKLRTLPTTRIGCPRCGNNLAYVWQVQTRESDQSSTQFFRCTKCNYTFREYS